MYRIIVNGEIVRAKISKRDFENMIKYNRLQFSGCAEFAKKLLLADLPINLSEVELFRISRFGYVARLPKSVYLSLTPTWDQAQQLTKAGALVGPYGQDPSIAFICEMGGRGA